MKLNFNRFEASNKQKQKNLMMKTTKFLLSLFLIASISIISCDKAKNENESVSIKVVQDEAIADILWNSIDADVDYASDLMKSSGYKSVTDTCPIIIVDHPDSLFYPRTITIDFGEACETFYGRIKSGKIVIHISAPIYEEGSVRTVSFEDYYINEHHIEGTKTLTNMGLNTSGNMNWDVALTGGKITFPNGNITTRTLNHNREWIKGINTPTYWWDDEWYITGTASGSNANGASYHNTITTPVLVKSVCRFPVSGNINMEIDDLGTFVIDYGDGACDNEATVTYGEQVWTILLN